MRKYVLSALTALVVLSPSAFTPKTALASATQSPASSIVLSLNTTSTQAIVGRSSAVGDFNTEVASPAKATYAAGRLKAAQDTLARAGLKTEFAAEYLAAQDRTGTPWQLIASVHMIETGQSGTTTVASYAGAQGPMQFLPSTYRAYALDGNGDGRSNIYDASDAILTGANYLRAGGAARGDYHSAVFNYNHAEWYVTKVMSVAHRLGLK